MRVFLTGANGLVGSHILDLLRASQVEVVILLRRTSNTRFIEEHLPHVQVRYGSLEDDDVLREAVREVDCIIHCAGKTSVLKTAEFYRANREGPRNVVRAANAHKGSLRHLIHISSRAVFGPSTVVNAAREDDPSQPISDYGRSKLLGEREVTEHCEVPYTVLRPSAVYGPRDEAFLFAFQVVQLRLMPAFTGRKQQINLVYARDVAEAVLRCLDRREAFGRVYNVASPEPCTTADLFEEIGRQMRVRPVPVPLPLAALYPVCVAREILSRITRKPHILNRQKYAELSAPGWVCSSERIRRELGYVAHTSLQEGIARTLDWYRRNGWL